MTRDEIIGRAREAKESLVVPSRWCSAEHRRRQTELFYQTLAELNILRQMLKAVNEEREACAQMVERLGQEGYGTLAIAAALRQGEKQ